MPTCPPLATVETTNEPAQRVAAKHGFEFWKMAIVDGYLGSIHLLQINGCLARRAG